MESSLSLLGKESWAVSVTLTLVTVLVNPSGKWIFIKHSVA